MSPFWQGLILGGFLGAMVGCLSMALAVCASQAERRREQMETTDLRALYQERVKANRRQATATEPHGLAIVRDGYDREQVNDGRTW